MLRKLLFRISGKEDKDKRVPTRLIMDQAISYGFSMLRGYIKTIGCKKRGKVFLGKHTNIYGKDMLTVGDSVSFGNNCYISCYSRIGVNIGSYSRIGDNSVIRCSVLQHLGEGVKIGNNTSFDAGCFLGALGLIQIGNDVIAGRDIKFHAENHVFSDISVLIRDQGVSAKGIIIGNNCWIGSNVVFVDGASIGNGCVVAAGAVVIGKFPNNTVIAGVPAKVVRRRGMDDNVNHT